MSVDLAVARLVDESYTSVTECGGPVRALHYPSGEIGIGHTCKTVDGVTLIIAPLLDPAHVIESLDPLTVSPSILCPDCGLHGFIRSGVWVP